MELAVHIRKPQHGEGLNEIQKHLLGFYDKADIQNAGWGWELGRSVDRIYIGDEFCANRLPTLAELEDLLQFAAAENKETTFLAPPLTNEGLDACSFLFDCLKDKSPCAEIVANDWGTLLFLKTRYPSFRLAAGRLLDKGFKDPRLQDADRLSLFSPETEALLNASAFDHAGFQEEMVELGVSRLERDIFPYVRRKLCGSPKLGISVYFPFGYITMGRVCWTATFAQPPGGMFVASGKCARTCDTMPLLLRSDDFSFPVIQNGNTVYYLYPISLVASLVEVARNQNLRLVYQGFVLH
jgi:hypothetical protein